MQPFIAFDVNAELDYHRERIAHDLRGTRRVSGRRHLHFPHRRHQVDVVAPYGDARA